MTIEDVVKRLTERYTKDFNPIVVDDFQLWLERQDINSLQLDVLYNSIIENWNYKTFPPLKKIKEWWGAKGKVNSYTNYPTIQKVLEETRSWSVENILKEYDEIKLKGDAIGRDNLLIRDKHFLYVWDDLIHYDWQLREFRHSELEITNYLEGVKESIIRGEKVGYGSHLDDRRTPEEKDISKAKRAEQFRKLQEQMSKNFPSVREA